MEKNFLKSKIKRGFEQERELLRHEVEKKPPLPVLSYVRPIFFAVVLAVTLTALGMNVIAAIKFFIPQ